MNSFSDHSRLANLIIAGVNKAGSTSLFHYLSAHPDFCGSLDKETCYFLPLLYHQPRGPLSDYKDQFAQCSGLEKYRLEATPAYFYGGKAIANEINQTLPGCRVIIIFKDPVDRLLSFYHRKKTTFQLPRELTLHEYVNKCINIDDDEILNEENKLFTGVWFGMYHKHIESWMDIFGDRLKIVFFDDLKKDAPSMMQGICEWLGTDTNFYDHYSIDVMNKSHDYKNRFLHCIALAANNAGKRVWRNYPALKKSVMSLYYKFNGTPLEKHGQDDETILFLRNYFLEHNHQLQLILEKRGITSLPKWLQQPVNIPA
jgi:hypothetical protein